jgi:hypothetical protein
MHPAVVDENADDQNYLYFSLCIYLLWFYFSAFFVEDFARWVLRQYLATQPMLLFCLSLLGAGIAGVYHHAQLLWVLMQ